MQRESVLSLITKLKISLDKRLYQNTILGCIILKDAEAIINHDERSLSIRYLLPWSIHKELDLITKCSDIPVRQDSSSLDFPESKILYEFLFDIAKLIYQKISKIKKWPYLWLNQEIEHLAQDEGRYLIVLISPLVESQKKDYILKKIISVDLGLYEEYVRDEELKKINRIKNNKLKNRLRKELKEKIQRMSLERYKQLWRPDRPWRSIDKSLLEGKNKYNPKRIISMLKKLKIITKDFDVSDNISQNKFLRSLKRAMEKIYYGGTIKKFKFRKCLVCGKEFSLLTRQSRKFCSNACRQKEYRIHQISRQNNI